MNYDLSPEQIREAYQRAVLRVEADLKILDVQARKDLGLSLKEEHFPTEQAYIDHLAAEETPLPKTGGDNKHHMELISSVNQDLKTIDEKKPAPERSALFKLVDAAETVLKTLNQPLTYDTHLIDDYEAGVQNKQSMARLDKNLKKFKLGPPPNVKPAESYWQPGKAPWEQDGYKTETEGLNRSTEKMGKHDQTADNLNKAYSALADARAGVNRSSMSHGSDCNLSPDYKEALDTAAILTALHLFDGPNKQA